MSVFRDKRSPTYWYFDFQLSGRRFYGTTKRTTRREALAVEQAVRETVSLSLPKPTPTLRSRQLPKRIRTQKKTSGAPSHAPEADSFHQQQPHHHSGHHQTGANGHDGDRQEDRPRQ